MASVFPLAALAVFCLCMPAPVWSNASPSWLPLRARSPPSVPAPIIRGQLSPLWAALAGYPRAPQGAAQLEYRHVFVVFVSLWEGWAAFHAQAQGFLFGARFQQPREECVVGNALICAAYSLQASIALTYPEETHAVAAVLQTFGLDPLSQGPAAKICSSIGAAAGHFFLTDPFNQDGSRPNVTFFRVPFSDYTNYQPVNGPYAIKDPTRFQTEFFFVLNAQSVRAFAAPFYGAYPSPLFKSPKEFIQLVPKPPTLRPSSKEFLQQGRRLIRQSAGLTDEQKMLAEFVENGQVASALLDEFLLNKFNATVETQVQLTFLQAFTAYQANIAVFFFKRYYDTARPTTFIRGLPFGTIKAWGGPCKGAVNMSHTEWNNYLLKVLPDPEYPSGGVCLFTILSVISKRLLRVNKIDWVVPFAKGSSTVEPGCTPSQDIVLTFPTLNSLVPQAQLARQFAGFHFTAATEASAALCADIGERAFAFANTNLFKSP